MKLGFEDLQAPFRSGSQNARAWTERWVADWVYCPNCGNPKINQLPANLPVADFLCPSCGDQYELKSQKKPFGAKVVDGAFSKKQERLASSSSPNLLLLNYDLSEQSVRNLCIVPKHFFVPEVIEERKPLAPTARRAGWIGSNILLSQIPQSGRVFIVQDGRPLSKDSVLTKWRRTLFLRNETTEARGWLIEVMNCLDSMGKREFTLDEAYAFEDTLAAIYPQNRNVRPKIRQQLQFLRDRGYLEFVSRGRYKLRTSD